MSERELTVGEMIDRWRERRRGRKVGGGGSITGGSCCIDPKCAVQGHCFFFSFFLFFFFLFFPPVYQTRMRDEYVRWIEGQERNAFIFPLSFFHFLSLFVKNDVRCSGYIRNIYIIFFFYSIHDKEVTRFFKYIIYDERQKFVAKIFPKKNARKLFFPFFLNRCIIITTKHLSFHPFPFLHPRATVDKTHGYVRASISRIESVVAALSIGPRVRLAAICTKFKPREK